ncbi:CPA1 family monovalent cation:H+ antiporter [Nocardioides sp. BE266]|uniref:Na+/H+ antiporter n=1 Tax=Nocardioides sp. BE266 TaxID=2817725 RepID=UPI0028613CA4|nr:Na+/H+ antiporter [Nocardioides sp. BE266]MDR7253135.1 CPA1 family monovalent cation:H+ antiporter [Nocardioides sp. BE266]
MELALLLVSMAAVVLAATAISDRLHVPAPLLLILVGAAASYVPGVPTIHLESEVVLLGLLPPLLYAAAIQTSLVDFNANRGTILRLSVLLVVVSALAVAAVVHWLVPDIGWAAAIAIGAVVAPPDAVAATAVARRIGLPRRVVTILEGESLLNDATALVALRTATAALGGSVAMAEVGLDFAVAAGGGVLIGVALFLLIAWLRKRITDPLMDTAISFLTPFAAFVAAEEIHASGVISVVVAGLLLGHKAPIIQTAQSRITERITWRTVAFVLENTVFLLIGLQLDWILEDVRESTLPVGRIALVCVATVATVIVVRLVYMYVTWVFRRSNPIPATWTFLIGWAGMRGVVTLAAAFVIPEDAPHREVLLLVAFSVVAGTLFLQGLTLPLVTRLLDVPPPDPAEDALSRAALLQQASDAGFAKLEELEFDDDHGVMDQIRARLEQRTFAAWEQLATAPGQETPSELYARIRGEMIEAERAKVLLVRNKGKLASEVVSQVLGMLDIEESMLDAGADAREGVRTGTLVFTAGRQCEDLETHPAVETRSGPGCATCLADGTRWVSLRQCLECGNIGCCDSSIGKHATAHFHDTLHPVIESAEPDESWRWCYVHNLTG